MSWHLKQYADQYAINPQAKKSCVLIPGWGMNSDIFESLLPALSQDFIVYLADATSYSDMPTPVIATAQLQQLIAEQISGNVTLIGWSLGGNIAVQLALDFPRTVNALCLLACSPAFVANDNWPQAMPNKIFQLFVDGIEKNSDKTLKRFDLLQAKGDAQQKNLSHALSEFRQQQSLLSVQELSAGLHLLSLFDQSSRLCELSQPLLWCFGEKDQLVNAAMAADAAKIIGDDKVHVFEGASHLPFLTATDDLFNVLQPFIDLIDKSRVNDKKKIAQSFSKAACGYDAAAEVQKMIAEKLITSLPNNKNAVLLDAGCGTGFWTSQLKDDFNTVIGMDMAEGMLQFAQQKNTHKKVFFCGGDMEQLPLANKSVDIIFSSLAVQWCESLLPLFNEWARVLKPEGKVFLATLGPKTLLELKMSFQAADDASHVNTFLSVDDISRQVDQSALSMEQLSSEIIVMHYERMRDLMADLKSIGAQTLTHQFGKSASGLMGKNRFKKAVHAYEAFREPSGFLPASYDVIYLQLVKN